MTPVGRDKVGSGIPGEQRVGCPQTRFEIVGLLSGSRGSMWVRPLPLPPSPSDGEGERGVRVGRAHVLSPCPLSIRWRGGAGVRFTSPCVCRTYCPRIQEFGFRYARQGTSHHT